MTPTQIAAVLVVGAILLPLSASLLLLATGLTNRILGLETEVESVFGSDPVSNASDTSRNSKPKPIRVPDFSQAFGITFLIWIVILGVRFAIRYQIDQPIVVYAVSAVSSFVINLLVLRQLLPTTTERAFVICCVLSLFGMAIFLTGYFLYINFLAI